MDADVQLITSLAGKYALLDFLAIFLAEYLPYVLIAIFLVVLLMQKERRYRLYVFCFWAVSLLLANGIIEPLINYLYPRPRPFVEYGLTPLISMVPTDPSFPSFHATLFFALATVVFFSMNRAWGGWLYVLAALIGTARVFAGVHYPLDIIAGALIGFLVVVLVRLFLPPVAQFRPKPELAESLEVDVEEEDAQEASF